MRVDRTCTFNWTVLTCLSVFFVSICCKDVKVFQQGKISLIDETQFSKDYSLESDYEPTEADPDNMYDEKVPFLPRFVLHKLGKDRGWTSVPIITRKGPTWSTPRPLTNRGETYHTWSTPKLEPVTKPPPTRASTAGSEKVATPKIPEWTPEKEREFQLKHGLVIDSVAGNSVSDVENSIDPADIKKLDVNERFVDTSESVKKPLTVESLEVVDVFAAAPTTTTEEPTTTASTTTEQPSTTTPSTTLSTTTATEKPSLRPFSTTKETPVKRPTTSKSTEDPSKPLENPQMIKSAESLEEPAVTKSRLVFKSKTTETMFPKPTTPEFRIRNLIRERLRSGAFKSAVLPQQRKFAQRFGIRRVVPVESTTTAATTVPATADPESPFHFIVPNPEQTTTNNENDNSQAAGMEQHVKSNTLVLKAETNKNAFFLSTNHSGDADSFSNSEKPSSELPKVVHRWTSTWSSWSSWGPDGKVHTGSTKTFSTEAPQTTLSPISRTRGRQMPSRFSGESLRNRHSSVFSPHRDAMAHQQQAPTPNAPRSPPHPSVIPTTRGPLRIHHSTTTETPAPTRQAPHPRPRVLKPPVIRPQGQRYRGPTYNCRVLTPERDGSPSVQNDASCPLKYPGFPADDSCSCTYQVAGRDEHGCATGFLYTCFRK